MQFWELAILCVYYIVDVLSISVNVAVIMLILFCTPGYLKRFSLLLLHTAIIDFIASVAGALSVTSWWIIRHPAPRKRIILLVFILLSPFPIVGSIICTWGLTDEAHIDSLGGLLIYYNQTVDLDRFTICGVPKATDLRIVQSMAVAGVCGPIVYTSIESSPDFFCQTRTLYVSLDLKTNFVKFIEDLRIVQSMAVAGVCGPIVYTSIIILRRRINVAMQGMPEKGAGKVLHKKMLQVITMQAILPLGSSVTLLLYFVAQFLLPNVDVIQYLIVLPTSIVPILQPFITLLYVTPYRAKLLSVFGLTTTSLKELMKEERLGRSKHSGSQTSTFNSLRRISIGTSIVGDATTTTTRTTRSMSTNAWGNTN